MQKQASLPPQPSTEHIRFPSSQNCGDFVPGNLLLLTWIERRQEKDGSDPNRSIVVRQDSFDERSLSGTPVLTEDASRLYNESSTENSTQNNTPTSVRWAGVLVFVLALIVMGFSCLCSLAFRYLPLREIVEEFLFETLELNVNDHEIFVKVCLTASGRTHSLLFARGSSTVLFLSLLLSRVLLPLACPTYQNL